MIHILINVYKIIKHVCAGKTSNLQIIINLSCKNKNVYCYKFFWYYYDKLIVLLFSSIRFDILKVDIYSKWYKSIEEIL